MYHSGIGGGGFALIRDSHGTYEAIDYREAAPATAFENMYKGNLDGAVVGGLSVAVPGDLKGLEYLHTKYGVSRWMDGSHPLRWLLRWTFFFWVQKRMNETDLLTKGNLSRYCRGGRW